MQVPAELKLKYLNRRIQDIQKLRLSLENDDYSLAMKLGHQVKGNATTFDFPQIAFLGVEIEQAARKKDKNVVQALVMRMETAIQSAQENFQG